MGGTGAGGTTDGSGSGEEVEEEGGASPSCFAFCSDSFSRRMTGGRTSVNTQGEGATSGRGGKGTALNMAEETEDVEEGEDSEEAESSEDRSGASGVVVESPLCCCLSSRYSWAREE